MADDSNVVSGKVEIFCPTVSVQVSTFSEVIFIGTASTEMALRSFEALSTEHYPRMLAWNMPMKVDEKENLGLEAIEARLKKTRALCLLMLASVRPDFKCRVNNLLCDAPKPSHPNPHFCIVCSRLFVCMVERRVTAWHSLHSVS